MEAGFEKLAPGQTYNVNKGEFITATVPDKVWKQGVVEFKDLLKLIVATQEFDVRLMAQLDLDFPPSTRSVTRGASPRSGSLNRLMNRVQTRHIGVAQPEESLDDWYATEVTFTTIRPLESSPVPNTAGRTVELAGGVRLLDHPGLVANARLSTAAVSSRALGDVSLPRLLCDDPSTCVPFRFTTTRGPGEGLSTLVLTDIQAESHTSVTADAPLRLEVANPLGHGEFVLPVGYDGEFFLPLGHSRRSASGGTELVLERLPAPTADGKRSLGGSIRIFFQKFIDGRAGVPYEYPILAAARVSHGDADSVEYVKDRETIMRLVAGSSTILLFVHGIIGDTREMASSVSRGGFADKYDLILTYDYENLNTPIRENAIQLGKRLAAVGLAAGHGKGLDVAAHSMGGLVSRWFIEREGGNQVVRRLVMLGTPNAGSPWPRLADWATMAVAMGLNGLTASLWPSVVMHGLARALGDARMTLTEMIPKSEILEELERSPDPGIPYTMLAGDTSIVPAQPGAENPALRLVERLFGANAFYAIANPFFLGELNDIAVAVSSMTHLPDGWKRPVHVVKSECDHLTYFHSKPGLDHLREVLGS